MICKSRQPRWGIVAVLVIGLAPFWFPSPAPAQKVVVERPDADEPPDEEISYWYCSGCKYILGYGDDPPDIRRCPGCGHRLEYRDMERARKAPIPAIPAFSWPEINLSPPVLTGAVVTATILLVGGLYVLLNRNEGPAKIEEKLEDA